MLNPIVLKVFLVAPCIGAWIEIGEFLRSGREGFVAPCIGAWIEIAFSSSCGVFAFVAPCIGAWIEILAAEFRRLSIGV
ncbi:hypothetical protein SAMN05421787_11259 [Virgibacillus pantothenticus]|nr:hypothetical protein SAMN05421787_11259 [Virgibacillus pantothenticus]